MSISQNEFWNEEGGKFWSENKQLMDNMLYPLGKVALDGLNVKEGMHVLDVGCGAGSTTIELSSLVGREGLITGIDISNPLTSKARKLSKQLNLKNVNFKVFNIQTTDLLPDSFDRAYSRFGLMFFEDPFVAFSNINNSLKLDAKLSFVCWQEPKLNPWQYLPIKKLINFIDFPTFEPRQPGPFAFQEKEYITKILIKSGFKKIQIHSHKQNITLFKGLNLSQAVEKFLSMNPIVSQVIKEKNNSFRSKVFGAVEEVWFPFYKNDVLQFPSACWIVNACK